MLPQISAFKAFAACRVRVAPQYNFVFTTGWWHFGLGR